MSTESSTQAGEEIVVQEADESGDTNTSMKEYQSSQCQPSHVSQQEDDSLVHHQEVAQPSSSSSASAKSRDNEENIGFNCRFNQGLTNVLVNANEAMNKFSLHSTGNGRVYPGIIPHPLPSISSQIQRSRRVVSEDKFTKGCLLDEYLRIEMANVIYLFPQLKCLVSGVYVDKRGHNSCDIDGDYINYKKNGSPELVRSKIKLSFFSFTCRYCKCMKARKESEIMKHVEVAHGITEYGVQFRDPTYIGAFMSRKGGIYSIRGGLVCGYCVSKSVILFPSAPINKRRTTRKGLEKYFQHYGRFHKHSLEGEIKEAKEAAEAEEREFPPHE